MPVPSHTNFCASSFSNWCHIGFLFKIFFDTRIAAELTKEVTDKELLNALGIHRVPYVKSFENIMANDGHHESWKFLLHIQILSVLLTLRSPEDMAGGVCRENDDLLEGNDEGGEELCVLTPRWGCSKSCFCVSLQVW